MEIKENEYIRYILTNGYTVIISKVTKMENRRLDYAYYLDDSKEEVYSSHFDDILKHSKDIIDLIEVGDYVNGRKVIFTKNNFPKGYCKNNKNDVVFTDYNDEYGEWFGFESDEIETVLTHEQFEDNAYKIEKEV